MDEKYKEFIKRNHKILNEIFSEKLNKTATEVFEMPEELRARKIDVVNELRTWLREIEIISKGQEIKPTNFV